MPTKPEDEMIIFVKEEESSLQYMGEEGILRGLKTITKKVEVEALIVNVNDFITKIDRIVEKTPKNVGGFELETIEFQAEINGEGQLGLPGSGVSMGATAGLTFTLKRKK